MPRAKTSTRKKTASRALRKSGPKPKPAQLPKPKSRIQLANERKIIDAAIKQFSRHGFRGATIDQIAEGAKLSKPNLLYYFKTKEELYAASLNYVLDIWLSPLETLNPDDDPESALSRYIDKKMELSRKHPDASRMFAMEIIEGAKTVKPVLDTKLAQLTQSKRRVLAKWSREGRLAKIDGVHLLFMIWAVTQHYADFEAQVESQTGKTLHDNQFFKETTDTIKKIIFHGAIR